MSAVVSGAPRDDALVHVALRLEAARENALAQKLRESGFEHRFVRRPEELAAALPDMEWLLIGRPPRIDWSRAARLRLLQVAGSGVDPLFPATGLPESVHIANARGVQADAVRDHAVALLLALARRLPDAIERKARREWKRDAIPPLAGRLLAILGFGAVGSRLATTAVSLGLRVRVLRRTPEPAPGAEHVSAEGGLAEVLSGADFVVVCLPLTRRTQGLVDAAALSHLAPSARIVDVSRGGIVDHHALCAALESGRLAAAALDVFEDEPLPADSALWSCPRLLMTPHTAGYTPDYLERTVDLFLENVARVRSGDVPLTAVSREQEY